MTDTNKSPENAAQSDTSTAPTSDQAPALLESSASDKKRLIALFSDGKLPTGENFEDLINSMVSESTFAAHVQKCKDWETSGDIQIGPKDKGWQLLLGSKSELGLKPDSENDVTADKAVIDLFGWTKSYGHIGTVRDREAFSKSDPVMPLESLLDVASDGRWKVLMKMPGRVCAFDLVLATAETSTSSMSGLRRLLNWVVGYIPPENAIIRVTATGTGPNHEPMLSNQNRTTADTTMTPFWYVVLVLATAAVLALLGIDLSSHETNSAILTFLMQPIDAVRAFVNGLASPEDHPLISAWMPWISGLSGGAALALIARTGLKMVTARRNGLRLRWKKSGGSRMKGNRAWRLEVKGPDMGKGENAKLYYHITALWG